MGNVDLNARIPNNVGLRDDKRLRRALEAWQPHFIDWWLEMGPEGFQADEIYLRTAVDVGRDGWAHFDHVKMPDYRWGIFMSPQEKDRVIPCGDHFGDQAWQQVPGEYRNALRRIIVTQADTEPASVEQQRLLGKYRAEPVRPAQPVPGQRRRGPPPLGHGLSPPHAVRPRRPRGSRGSAAAPLGQRGRRASSARSTSRCRTGCLLHVHDLHGSGRQVPAPLPGGVRARPTARAPRASC